jgi:hypothetical protein
MLIFVSPTKYEAFHLVHTSYFLIALTYLGQALLLRIHGFGPKKSCTMFFHSNFNMHVLWYVVLDDAEAAILVDSPRNSWLLDLPLFAFIKHHVGIPLTTVF